MATIKAQQCHRLYYYLWISFSVILHSSCAQTSHSNKPFDRTKLAPFDTNIRQDCLDLQLMCQSEFFAHVFLQCPAMCSSLLEVEGMIGTANDEDESLIYDVVDSLRTRSGQRISPDRFEGFVTVIGITPLLPGMAVYFYEMFDYLHSVFIPKVEFVIIPIDHGHGIHIAERPNNPKVVVLEEESAIETHRWVQYLTSIQPRSGAASQDHHGNVVQMDLHTDRVTIYIVSADGYYIERLISPSMATLQSKIGVYLKTIDYEL